MPVFVVLLAIVFHAKVILHSAVHHIHLFVVVQELFILSVDISNALLLIWCLELDLSLLLLHGL